MKLVVWNHSTPPRVDTFFILNAYSNPSKHGKFSSCSINHSIVWFIWFCMCISDQENKPANCPMCSCRIIKRNCQQVYLSKAVNRSTKNKKVNKMCCKPSISNWFEHNAWRYNGNNNNIFGYTRMFSWTRGKMKQSVYSLFFWLNEWNCGIKWMVFLQQWQQRKPLCNSKYNYIVCICFFYLYR